MIVPPYPVPEPSKVPFLYTLSESSASSESAWSVFSLLSVESFSDLLSASEEASEEVLLSAAVFCSS